MFNQQPTHLQQLIPDLPREDVGLIPLHLLDFGLDFRGGHPGLGAPDDAGPYAAGLLITIEDF